ncbi:unnamed protein product [Closterium sp. NIES-54]
MSSPARTVSRCLADTRTACTPHVAPCCNLRVVPCCPAQRAPPYPATRAHLPCSPCIAFPALRPTRLPALQLVSRTSLPCSPACHTLLPRVLHPAAACASRSAAPLVMPCCSPRVALCCPARRALLPCTACALLPYPPHALPCSPRRALPFPARPSRAALPRSPAPPSHPVATTAPAAARAFATAGGGAAGSAGGVGGAIGSAGGAAGAGGATGSTGGAAGAGPTTDRHSLSWPLSRQLQRLGVDSGGHCLSRTTPPLSSFASGFFSEPVRVVEALVFCVLHRGGSRAAALGASESTSALGASEPAAALGASESAVALGASESAAAPDASDLYTLTTASTQVAEVGQLAASSQVSASCQLAASCSCRVLSHQTLLWHHRLGHPSLPRLRSMHSRLLGPAPVGGTDRERYFLLVVDDYTRYTTVFPLRRKADVSGVLIPWIRATRRQLPEQFSQNFLVLRLHSDRGGEFSSGLLAEFCRDEGNIQSFMLPASPQQNGIAERRIGLIMEVARTSMIHAAAPHFLWPFAVRYAAH